MIVIAKDIEKVVVAMRTDAVLIQALSDAYGAQYEAWMPEYMYGHRLEISNRLMAKGKDPGKKDERYPLVALRLDTDEDWGNELVEFNLNIAIVTYTKKEYISTQRMDNIFIPILYPLYESFKRNLPKGGFTWKSSKLKEPPHTKTDRLFYGTVGGEGNTGYIFQDPLDAIELTNLRISKLDNKC